MKLFRECYSGNTHFMSDPFPKQYRYYTDEKDSVCDPPKDDKR